MRILVFSDTHDRLSKIEFLRKKVEEIKPDYLIHLGDFVSPFFIYQMFKDLKKEVGVQKIILIKGNNDGDIELIKKTCDKVDAEFYPEFYKDKIDGKNIFAIHKPDIAEMLAKSGDFDYLFYGHTHKTDDRKINNSRLINPGTASGYLAEKATFITLDISKDQLVFHEIN